MRRIAILFLILSIFTCTLNASPFVNPVLSLVVPGLGQFMNRQWVKGIVIAGIEVAYGIYSYNYYSQNGTLPPNFAMITGGILAYSTIDAYIDAELSSKETVTEQWKKEADTPDSSEAQQDTIQ